MKQIENPPNPFQSVHRDLLEPAGDARLSVYDDASRTILTPNDSPDLSFRWSVNPYRGCFHSCAYCYARQYHEYLDFGAGTDFESKIAVKRNAPDLLRSAFRRRSWKGETVTFSGATDCYQPLEAVYGLTRACLEVCREFRNPVAVITKGFLITRDAGLLADLAGIGAATAVLSIPFADEATARAVEPQASTLARRFKAVEILASRGVPVGVSLAPTIPGLNDQDIPAILKRARESGARFAFHTLLRLPGSVRTVFEENLRKRLPKERVDRVMKRLGEMRGGALDDARPGRRFRGEGPYWKSISDLFRLAKKKYGFEDFPDDPSPSPFRVPSAQLDLL